MFRALQIVGAALLALFLTVLLSWLFFVVVLSLEV